MSEIRFFTQVFRQTLILGRHATLPVRIMSELSGKKPSTRDEFIRQLSAATKKEMEAKRTEKATIAGTAKLMKIHRDTLYEWMREFGVDFDDVTKDESAPSVRAEEKAGKFTYLIGEALVGEGTEVAHVDLLVGDKGVLLERRLRRVCRICLLGTRLCWL